MTIARGAVLVCLSLSVYSPALAQVAPWPGSAVMQGTRIQSSGIAVPRPITPSPPRWGGGPPPPGPFDQPIPSAVSGVPRPGRDAFRAGPTTYAPRYSTTPGVDRRRDRRHDGPRDGPRRHDGSKGVLYPTTPTVYIGAAPYAPYYSPYYAWPYDYRRYDAPVPEYQETAPREAPEGFLRLLVTPRNARVFIDGAYEGTVDDFGGSGERALPAGPHAVRMEADGFDPVEFDVRVPANDTMTLRRDLEPRRLPPPPLLTPPRAAEPASPPKPIYVIPRCYLGDSPPDQSQLPAGCSVADVRRLN